MTWDELTKEYEKKRKTRKIHKKAQHWINLMESTNKLIWLYLMNNQGKENLEKTFN